MPGYDKEEAFLSIEGVSCRFGATEELGSARPLGVEVGLACRAAFSPEAVVARGSPGERKVSGRPVKDATGFGRTQAEACEKAAAKAAAGTALVEAVSRAIED